MATMMIPEKKLKVLLKDAVSEVLEEKKDFLREMMLEAIEDVALTRAIQLGEKSRTISKARVMHILQSNK